MKAQRYLQKTQDTIKQRGDAYGPIQPSMERAAVFASLLIGKNLTAFDLSRIMMAVKLSRLSVDPKHVDSWLDLAGYAAISVELVDDGNVVGADVVSINMSTVEAAIHASMPEMPAAEALKV